jgi:hypothetical protein
VVGSSFQRTHAGAYTHAGPEIGVKHLQSFTNRFNIEAAQ